MSLQKVCKTVYVVGDFGTKNRGGDFRPFTGKSGEQALDYNAFVEFFGVNTQELGILDEGNPFYRILRPWSPPGTPVAAGASEMAGVVVGAIPEVVREAAIAMADFDVAVQNLGKLRIYKNGDGIDANETPKVYAKLLNACCNCDDNALKEIFKEMHIKDEILHKWEMDHNELLKRLRSADRTFSEFANRSGDKNNLFQVLLKKRIQDVVDAAVKKYQGEFNEKAKKAGFKSNRDSEILDVISEGNGEHKAAFITSLVTRDHERLSSDVFACGDSKLYDFWKSFVENFKEWASGAVIPSDQVEAAWDRFIEARKAEWKNKYFEEMPGLRELELRTFFYACAGSKSLSEERVADLAFFAIKGIGLASRQGAQVAIANARSLGMAANKKDKPKRGDDLEIAAGKFANDTEANWTTEEVKIITKYANLVRVLTYYMSTLENHDQRKLVATMLLTALNNSTNMMVHFKSEDYIKLIDSFVEKAVEAYRTLQKSKDNKTSRDSGRNEGGAMQEPGQDSNSGTKDLNEQKADTVQVTVDASGNESSIGDGKESDIVDNKSERSGSNQNPGDKSNSGHDIGIQNAANPGKKESSDKDVKNSQQKGAEGKGEHQQDRSESQLDLLKDAFKSLGYTVDANQAGEKIVKDDLEAFYRTLYKAFSQLKRKERAGLESAAGQLEKSGLLYLTVMFMQRQGINFGDEEAASLGWIFELSRFRNEEEILKNVPLNQLLNMSSPGNLKEEWEGVKKQFEAMLGSANEKLSMLYGIEILLKSIHKDCKVYFYNGKPIEAVQELSKYPIYYDPINIGKEASQGVPTIIYFADNQQDALNALNGSEIRKCICPVILDAGPDFSTSDNPEGSKLWKTLTISKDCKPIVSLAGPGIRLRGATKIHGNHASQNNGLPSSPLIPAGALLLASLLDGQFKDHSGAELVLKDAEGEQVKAGYFPESSIVPPPPVELNVRFFLQRTTEGDSGDLIARTKHLLVKSGFVYDLAIWLAYLAKKIEVKNVFVRAPSGDVTVNLGADYFPEFLRNQNGINYPIIFKQDGTPGGVGSRPWKIKDLNNQNRNEYLEWLHREKQEF